MPFDTSPSAPRRIAVIGGGISGLGAARYLAAEHHVTLFEARSRLGGHARTKIAGRHGDQPVDTGFIVFNHANYPRLSRLFRELDVPVVPSRMSFGASLRGGALEYGLASLGALFAQKRNAFDPRFLGMVRDIFRFNARAAAAARDPGQSLGDFLAALGTGERFRDHYLVPLSGAIWSTPAEKILDFPAQALVRFFENHALLTYAGQHQWYTVAGGSLQYVERLTADLERRGVTLRRGAPVAAVRRGDAGVEIRAAGDEWQGFDEVVFATHSDDTLRLLADADGAERRALGAVAYQPNRVVLHSDAGLMPRRRACWSSWNYTEAAGGPGDSVDLTYWMNSLQPIPLDDPLFVTLNATRPIREELIHDETVLRHPVYDRAALAAQETLRDLNGARRTWFCGAWMGNGFHEDGLASAEAVTEGLRQRRAARSAA
ncbi:NAD(P)/FAD-dependent oxidoreductase [Roseivivax sp. CAU 1761]